METDVTGGCMRHAVHSYVEDISLLLLAWSTLFSSPCHGL